MNTLTGSQRYNNRMEKMFAESKRLKALHAVVNFGRVEGNRIIIELPEDYTDTEGMFDYIMFGLGER